MDEFLAALTCDRRPAPHFQQIAEQADAARAAQRAPVALGIRITRQPE
ncbi:hypothetical protein ABT234_08730 [Streptomyces sp. NPDC001586]